METEKTLTNTDLTKIKMSMLFDLFLIVSIIYNAK